MLRAALEYAKAGYPIFPCTPDKSPYTPNGYKDATTDLDQIRKWWAEFPHAMIGMPTGEASGVAVLDLDMKKGKNGFKHVTDWETRSPVIARTMTGGAHLYFKDDGTIYNTSDKIAKGVDTRGDGGYVIVPPSPGYRWVGDNDFSHAPEWPDDLRPPERNRDAGSNDELEAENPFEVVCALAVIPNDDLGWDDWNLLGMAMYSATNGSDIGKDAFVKFSAKSPKYNYKITVKRWNDYSKSPPDRIGAGTLYHKATEVDPQWLDKVHDWLVFKLQNRDYEGDFFEFYHEGPGVGRNGHTPPPKGPPPPPKDDGSSTPPPKKKSTLLVSSADFVAGFTPPDYLIDGLIQRRFLYSLTAQTNTGKTTVALLLASMVAEGQPLGKREIEKGKVLFFAGENPDDVRMRWIKLCEERKIDPGTPQMVWIPGNFSLKKLTSKLTTECKDHGPFSLIVIDTSAVYFEGDNENDNTQLGDYARKTLRPLVNMHGGPTILVLCHPIKSPQNDYLVPRGGGAFLNEVDGNLVLTVKSEAPKVVELHWQGKFRGADFSSIPFKLVPGACRDLRDSKGRELWTIVARTMTEKESDENDELSQKNQDALLAAMKVQDGRSLADLAKAIGWYYKDGDPNKTLVNRTMQELAKQKLVKLSRNKWVLSNGGRTSAGPAGDLM